MIKNRKFNSTSKSANLFSFALTIISMQMFLAVGENGEGTGRPDASGSFSAFCCVGRDCDGIREYIRARRGLFLDGFLYLLL